MDKKGRRTIRKAFLKAVDPEIKDGNKENTSGRQLKRV
jgi:hypothetical protein